MMQPCEHGSTASTSHSDVNMSAHWATHFRSSSPTVMYMKLPVTSCSGKAHTKRGQLTTQAGVPSLYPGLLGSATLRAVGPRHTLSSFLA